ncbi:MAG: transcriptional repressor [Spirochaetales bacterium]|nr:transcriptional repressor [Spirochaetales bacterium]
MKHCHKWGQKLVSNGFRLTVAREVILDILTNTDQHLSAEDIYLTIHPHNPGIGLTTIYRTLELLVQTGIVLKFDFGHGRAKYELSEEYSYKKHHHHVICKKCRRIVDYSDFFEQEQEFIRKAEEELKNKFHFTIENHFIQFYGICPECKPPG